MGAEDELVDRAAPDPNADPDPTAARRGSAALVSTPARVGWVVAAVALLFVLVRATVSMEGDVTRFIVAGDYTDPAAVPSEVHVFEGQGNDGQFNYRYALDPTELGLGAHLGVSIDLPLRAGRIGYPALAWLASLGGRPELVPYALVGVNVAALGLLGWMGALLARRASRPPVVGILLPAWSGFLFTLARDYGDIVGAAAAVGAICLPPRKHPIAHGLLLGGAVITRELYLVVVAALVLERLVELWKGRRRRPVASDLAWVLPAAIFAVWQWLASRQVGTFPITSGEGNRTFPFVGLLRAVRAWVTEILQRPDGWTEAAMAGLSLVQFLLLVVFSVTVGRAILHSARRARTRSARTTPVSRSDHLAPPAGVAGGWLLLALTLPLLSEDIWAAYNDFRNLSEFVVLGVVVLLSSREDLRPPTAALGASWWVTLVPRVVRV